MSEQANMAARYEHEIPEGYEARIEGNKVVIELKESEDERIRKELIEQVAHIVPDSTEFDDNGDVLSDYFKRIEKYRAYLERQKEPRDYRKLYEEVVKSEWFKENYVGKSLGEEQKPAEWSEEDEENLGKLHRLIFICRGEKKFIKESEYDKLDSFLKSLRPQPHWKPSVEQMYILNWVANILLNHDGIVEEEIAKKLQSLYQDLESL